MENSAAGHSNSNEKYLDKVWQIAMSNALSILPVECGSYLKNEGIISSTKDMAMEITQISRELSLEASQELIVEGSKELTVEDSQELTVEDSQELIVEVSQELPVEDSQELTVEDSQELIVEDSQELTVEGSHELTVEGSQELTVEGSQELTVEDSQELTVEDSQEPIVEDSQEPIKEDSQEVIVKDSQKMTVEDSQKLIIEDSLELIVEDSQGLIVEDSQKQIVEDSQELIVEYSQELIVEDFQKLTTEDYQKLKEDAAQKGIEENNLYQRNSLERYKEYSPDNIINNSQWKCQDGLQDTNQNDFRERIHDSYGQNRGNSNDLVKEIVSETYRKSNQERHKEQSEEMLHGESREHKNENVQIFQEEALKPCYEETKELYYENSCEEVCQESSLDLCRKDLHAPQKEISREQYQIGLHEHTQVDAHGKCQSELCQNHSQKLCREELQNPCKKESKELSDENAQEIKDNFAKHISDTSCYNGHDGCQCSYCTKGNRLKTEDDVSGVGSKQQEDGQRDIQNSLYISSITGNDPSASGSSDGSSENSSEADATEDKCKENEFDTCSFFEAHGNVSSNRVSSDYLQTGLNDGICEKVPEEKFTMSCHINRPRVTQSMNYVGKIQKRFPRIKLLSNRKDHTSDVGVPCRERKEIYQSEKEEEGISESEKDDEKSRCHSLTDPDLHDVREMTVVGRRIRVTDKEATKSKPIQNTLHKLTKSSKMVRHKICHTKDKAKTAISNTIPVNFKCNPKQIKHILKRRLPKQRLKLISDSLCIETFTLQISHNSSGIAAAYFSRDGKEFLPPIQMKDAKSVLHVRNLQITSIVIEVIIMVLQQVGVRVILTSTVLLSILEFFVEKICHLRSNVDKIIEAFETHNHVEKAKQVLSLVIECFNSKLIVEFMKILFKNMGQIALMAMIAETILKISVMIGTGAVAMIAQITVILIPAVNFRRKIENLVRLRQIHKEHSSVTEI